MAQTRDETRTAGVQMDDGQSRGQLTTPGQRQRLTNQEELQNLYDDVVASVESEKSELMNFLAGFGIDYDFFVSGMKLFLTRQLQSKPEFFRSITRASFLESLFRCAKDGLIPDGKEAAIGHFKGVATYMPMREGFVKVLWRTGMVKSINDQVVTRPEYDRGWFVYREGDNGYIEHQVDLERKDSDDTMAAYCVVELMTGGTIREVVPKADLDKIAKMSRSPARGDWKFQMDRKAAIRRVMGKMPREKGIAQLLAHDDDNYDSRLLTGGEAAAKPVPRASLFADKAAHRAPMAPAAEREPTPEEPAETGGEDAPGNPERASAIVTQIRNAETVDDVHEWKAEADKAEDLSDQEKTWIEETVGARLNAIAATGYALPPARLRAILSTVQGEKTWEDAALWQADFLAKMATLKGPALGQFWKTNYRFVQEARAIAEAQVQRIEQVAIEKGLMQAPAE